MKNSKDSSSALGCAIGVPWLLSVGAQLFSAQEKGTIWHSTHFIKRTAAVCWNLSPSSFITRNGCIKRAILGKLLKVSVVCTEYLQFS